MERARGGDDDGDDYPAPVHGARVRAHARSYARSGIPELWIVDVAGQSVEQYGQPRGDQYRTKQTHEYTGRVTATTLAQLALDVRQIFG